MTKNAYKNIIEDCRDFLDRYGKSQPCPHKREALLLKSQLKRIHSITEFKKTLDAAKPFIISTFFNVSEGGHSENPVFVYTTKTATTISQGVRHHVSAFFSVTKPSVDTPHDTYINRLANYQTRVAALIQAEASRATICARLKSFQAAPETQELISLLEEILSNPSCLLYEKTLTLLSLLKETMQLQKLVEHLQKQAPVARPDIPRAGSFDAALPLNHQHERCLDLLRNNTKSVVDGEGEGQHANCVLQTALILYESLHMSHELDKRCCVIL